MLLIFSVSFHDILCNIKYIYILFPVFLTSVNVKNIALISEGIRINLFCSQIWIAISWEHRFRLPQITCSNKVLVLWSFYSNWTKKVIDKNTFQGVWRDGSVPKTTCCFSRRPGCDSHFTTVCNSSFIQVIECLCLLRTPALNVHITSCRHSPLHKNSQNIFKKKTCFK